MTLPDGPGLAVRWAVAVPMTAVSMFAPWFGPVALSVWWFDDATERRGASRSTRTGEALLTTIEARAR